MKPRHGFLPRFVRELVLECCTLGRNVAGPGREIDAQTRSESREPIGAANPEAVREQVERIVADPLFRNSKRYSGLLKFVAERSLAGRTEDLKERIIGIEVFGRTPDYDTSNDATVRVTANEVRKRLFLYYNQPEHEQELRIDVPSGSYLAEFRLPELPHIPEPTPQAPPPEHARRDLRYVKFAVAAVILALAAWGLTRAMTPKSVIDQFWAPMLGSSQPLVFYLSSPSSAPSAAPSPPAASEGSEPQFHEFVREHRGQFTVMDVNAASGLSAFLKQHKQESIVRPAHGASLSDLRSAPAVLLGSYNNEWAMKLGEDLHYRFRRESEVGLRWIEDSANPQRRIWSMDLSEPYGKVTEDYALISRVQDPIAGRWLIIISGLTGSGTSAACEILKDPAAMASLSTHFPKNWASKNLQVVVAVKLIQGSPGASRVVGTYSW